MIKYSIIIPVYGCEKYLETCVKSVLNQKGNQSFEVILVDDGSIDRSGEIVDELAKCYAQVRTIHKENGGAASARNYGIREASGEYVLFIDSDDTVNEDLLNNVSAILASQESELIIYGMSFDYYKNDKLVHQEKLSSSYCGSKTIEEILESFQTLFDDNVFSSACNKVFRLEIIKKYDIKFSESMNLYEDFDFVIQYLTQTNKVYFIDIPLYHYRLHKEDNHLNKLVVDIVILKRNMLSLRDSIVDLQQKNAAFHKISSVYSNLNLRLLSLHLFLKQYTAKQLSKIIIDYLAEDVFAILYLKENVYGIHEKKLLDSILNERYLEISFIYHIKWLKSFLKRAVKKVLRY